MSYNRSGIALMYFILMGVLMPPGHCDTPAWRPPTLASPSTSKPAGALAERLERSLARLGKPPFTLPFIVADVSFSEKRIFTEYSGDISGRVLGVLAREAASGRKTQWPIGELLRELGKYQKADGHFGAEQDLAHGLLGERDMPILWGNSRLLIGLVEAYETGRDPLALAMARKLGGYYLTSDALLDRAELVDKFGNYAAGFATCYFSGLEGLVGLSRLTKDRRYLDQAERMAKLMAETTEAKEQHSHGRLCALRGLLDLYEATGKRANLDRVESEHAIWVKRFLWPTGGISEMSIPTFNRNEGCTEADWLRLNLQLWRLTGRDSYLDLADMTLKNDLAVDQFANGGFGHRVAVMTELRMDGYYPAAHEGTQEAYWCCSEHGPRALLDVASYEAAALGREVTLNLYEPAEMVLKVAHQPVHVIVAPTGLGERAAVVVKTSRPIRFALRLRVPGWCSGFRIDGKTPARAADGRVVVERTWRDGDKIEIQMPFSVHYRLDGDPAGGRRTLENDKSAMGSCVYYGPYLLVAPLAQDVKTLSASPTVSFKEIEARMRDGTGLKPAGNLPAESGFRCRVNLIP